VGSSIRTQSTGKEYANCIYFTVLAIKAFSSGGGGGGPFGRRLNPKAEEAKNRPEVLNPKPEEPNTKSDDLRPDNYATLSPEMKTGGGLTKECLARKPKDCVCKRNHRPEKKVRWKLQIEKMDCVLQKSAKSSGDKEILPMQWKNAEGQGLFGQGPLSLREIKQKHFLLSV